MVAAARLTILPHAGFTRMMAKKNKINVRRKGHQFERDIAILFQQAGFKNARRHLEYQMGEALGKDIANVEPYLIQCKATKKYVPLTTINEIQNQHEGIPVLIAKGDNLPPLACIPLAHFMELVKLYRELPLQDDEW